MALPLRSTHSRRGAIGLGVVLLLSGSTLAYVSTEIGSVSAQAASIGSLAITPATGGTDTTNTVAVTASATCPEPATNYVVTITGGGFPANSAAVGNTAIAEQAGTAIHAPLGQTWNTLAAVQKAPLPLTGIATLTLTCTDLFGAENYGDFSGQVKFTPGTGEAAAYEVLGGTPGSPSPSPTTGASPSPSPVPGTASPSPTPSTAPTPSPSLTPTVSPSPSASPDASASPSPTATACATPVPTAAPSPTASPTPGTAASQTVTVTVSPSASPVPCESPSPNPTPAAGGSTGSGGDGGAAGSGGGDGGGLPDTGASHAGPLLIVALSLLAGGTVLIAAASAPARRTQQA